MPIFLYLFIIVLYINDKVLQNNKAVKVEVSGQENGSAAH